MKPTPKPTTPRPRRVSTPPEGRRRRQQRRATGVRRPPSPKTQERYWELRALLDLAGRGATIAELAGALGWSRQLVLYHLKRLASGVGGGGVVLQLEPCAANGRLQYRCWSAVVLSQWYRAGAVSAAA